MSPRTGFGTSNSVVAALSSVSLLLSLEFLVVHPAAAIVCRFGLTRLFGGGFIGAVITWRWRGGRCSVDWSVWYAGGQAARRGSRL